MKYRTYPNTDITVSEVGFGLWTTVDRLVGRNDRRRGRRAAARGRTTRHHALRRRRHVRQRAQRGATRQSLRATAATRSSTRRSSATTVTTTAASAKARQIEIAARFLAEVRALRARGVARAACRPTTSTSGRCTTRTSNKSTTTNCGELLDDFMREGKMRACGVALGPAIGWLYEGVEAVRKRNVATLQMIWNIARAVSRATR